MVQEKRETERNMEAMWKIVKEAPPEGLGFLEMVLNHRSFPQTAENIFSLSFLVRSSLLSLSVALSAFSKLCHAGRGGLDALGLHTQTLSWCPACCAGEQQEGEDGQVRCEQQAGHADLSSQ